MPVCINNMLYKVVKTENKPVNDATDYTANRRQFDKLNIRLLQVSF